MAVEKMFSIRIDLETLDKIQKIAKREERSVSYIIRQACKEYVKREK
jgi:predicted transcriptional regulator